MEKRPLSAWMVLAFARWKIALLFFSSFDPMSLAQQSDLENFPICHKLINFIFHHAFWCWKFSKIFAFNRFVNAIRFYQSISSWSAGRFIEMWVRRIRWQSVWWTLVYSIHAEWHSSLCERVSGWACVWLFEKLSVRNGAIVNIASNAIGRQVTLSAEIYSKKTRHAVFTKSRNVFDGWKNACRTQLFPTILFSYFEC